MSVYAFASKKAAEANKHGRVFWKTAKDVPPPGDKERERILVLLKKFAIKTLGVEEICKPIKVLTK